jgi:hypothetical protein
MIAYRTNLSGFPKMDQPHVPTKRKASHSVMREIELASRATGLSISLVCREAANDPNLYSDLRQGRCIREPLKLRVLTGLRAMVERRA